MAKKNQNVDDSSLCASGLTDATERKVMATAMKQGEDQIKILRESKQETQEESEWPLQFFLILIK